MKLAPLAVDPSGAPPDGTVYHVMVLPAEVAFRFTEVPTQTVEGVAVRLEGCAQLPTVMMITPFPARTPCEWATPEAPAKA